MEIVLIVAAVALTALAGVGGVLWLRRMKAEAEAELRSHAARWLLVEPMVNFIGLASSGGMQLRGNGALGVTEEALWFVQWVPRRTLQIPRARITAVDQTRAHAGKAGPLMVRVTFTEEGRTEQAAWSVRDPDALQRVLSS